MTYQAAPSLAMLKPFQRATVDTVFARFFTDADPTSRFLVADEAGLGKTMVARGVIARTVERLQHEKKHITVVYLCSSQAIAQQNLKSLDVIGVADGACKRDKAGSNPHLLNTRPTLLALNTETRGKGLVDLISMTPGTALDLKSSGGRAEERALIYAMLRKRIGPDLNSARPFFRGGSREDGWPDYLKSQLHSLKPCKHHTADFNDAVGDDIIETIRESAKFASRNPNSEYPDHLRPAPIIGDLRRRLAHVGLSRLAPDLVVIDEFQRFADLLHDPGPQATNAQTEASELARMLFGSNPYEEDGPHAGGIPSPRILLLSATPYRMVSLKSDAEEEGDHYTDFIKTVGFLQGNAKPTTLETDLRTFRTALQSLPRSAPAALVAKNRIETALRKVMSRTERVTATAKRDAMVQEFKPPVTLQKEDLREACAINRIVQVVGAPSAVEYWKSSPYLLSFMRGYKLNRLLDKKLEDPDQELCSALKGAKRFMVQTASTYPKIDLRNGRMRALQQITMTDGLARALWIPPCRPSFGEPQAATKTLVFSDWSMVPDAIATLLSYEATRHMGLERDKKNSPTTKTDALLPVLYPCLTLAQKIDPLVIEAQNGRTESLADWRKQVGAALRVILKKDAPLPSGKRASIRLDWTNDRAIDWSPIAAEYPDEPLGEVSTEFEQLIDTKPGQPGPPGEKRARHDLLTDIALGSPATCALRSLMRVAPDIDADDPTLSAAALRIALAFRTLFDQPESHRLLAGGARKNEPYWRQILDWCTAHDLPAVLDEYVHLLNDTHAGISCQATRIGLIAESMADAISVRPATITLNRLSGSDDKPTIGTMSRKARFAMRFATDAEKDDGAKRTGLVQAAFKSPFRPFVLATTSIGQEGLDFHSYCSRVVHWNLPRNPVDIEQREGRVHRYKNHCVRRNLAAARGTDPLVRCDPWNQMFEDERKARIAEGEAGDLVPFWMLEGKARIERIALLPPMSREVRRYERLMRSLATYRLAFGQPRQAELFDLLDRVGEENVQMLADLQINLKPASSQIRP